MTRINLLDWRADRREARRRQFLSLLAVAAVISLAAVTLGYLTMEAALEHQKSRNDFLKQQIAALDVQIKEIQDLEKTRANLLARMKVIEQLQQSRSATVHFFQEVVDTLPDGVYLTGVKQSGQSITLDGIAESNGRISAYMKNLDASPWFNNPQLVVIQTSEANKLRSSKFTLQVQNLTTSTDSKKSGGAP